MFAAARSAARARVAADGALQRGFGRAGRALGGIPPVAAPLNS